MPKVNSTPKNKTGMNGVADAIRFSARTVKNGETYNLADGAKDIAKDIWASFNRPKDQSIRDTWSEENVVDGLFAIAEAIDHLSRTLYDIHQERLP